MLQQSVPRPRRRRRALTVVIVLALVPVAAVGCVSIAALVGPMIPGVLSAPKVDTVDNVNFETPLAIPPLADSSVEADGTRVFELAAQQGTSTFVPGITTPTMGFNGAYLGPTLRAGNGEKVRVDVTNDLGAATSVHWHGMHLPAAMDGGPHQEVGPGETWSPTWTIDQPAATLWYHPHPHGETEEQVRAGLAGLFYVDDEETAAFDLPETYGVDDVPVVVQDVAFGRDGSMNAANQAFVGTLGDQLLVNGVIGPYLDVTTELVRLRLVNASSARVYEFGLSDDRTFQLIATDGGLLESPYLTGSIRLSPGERAEIVVRMQPGEKVVLRSETPELGSQQSNASGNGGADRFDVLELRAGAQLTAGTEVPPQLARISRLAEADAVTTRSFSLDGFTINGQGMAMDRIDATMTRGSTEVWSVQNGMTMPHNFHVHDVQFQVLAIGGEDPGPELSGWKDTIYLEPQRDYRIIMRFDDFADPDMPYMYHCHLLWHEDSGMMGQFVVVEPGEKAGTIPGSKNKTNPKSGTGPRGSDGGHHEH